MGSRRHEHLDRDALLARKDEQICNLDAHLHQTIAHLSLVRARLLSALDQLDALQQEHTAALAAAAREQRVLEARLRAAEEMARDGEADRMDMREAVGMLVKKVEATPDFRNWPRSQIHLSRLAEPSLLSSPHPPHASPSKSKSHLKQHPTTLPDHEGPSIPDNDHHQNYTYIHNQTYNHHNHNHPNHTYNDQPNHAALTEQLAYACTLISHFRSARDAAVVRAERGEARVLALEAKVARREAEAEMEMEACPLVEVIPGRMASPASSRRKPPPKPHNGVRQADPDEIHEIDDTTAILDVSAERNMELEREVKRLSQRLDSARAARDGRGGVRGATTSRPHHSQEQEQHIQHLPVTLRDRGPTPPLRQQHQQQYAGGDDYNDANASLLSSLSFSPSSSASSGAEGSVTPRQYAPREHRDEYRSGRRAYHGTGDEALAGYEYDNDSDHVDDERSFSIYDDADEDEEVDGEDEEEDGDQSTTQPLSVDEPDVKAATLPASTTNTDIHLKYYDSVMSDDTAIIKPVTIPIPVPALRALERQIALLGEKIDAFAAERRRVARGVVDAGGGLHTLGRGPHTRAKVDVEVDEDEDMHADVVEGTRTDCDAASRDVAGVLGGRNHNTGVSDRGGQHACIDQQQRGEESKVHYDYGGSGAVHSSTQESSVQHFKSTTPQPQSRPDHDNTGYDHPHGTCEGMLLAARKREMELVARVRVLEGALSGVEAQVRRCAETGPDADAERRDWVEAGEVTEGSAIFAQAAVAQETHACWVDAAVQTLKTPPQAPLITPAPVGDLLGLDVPELRVVEEEKRMSAERQHEGALDRDDEGDGTDEGEMPMELATPLLPVLSIPAPDTDDENELGGPRNGRDEGSYELESEAGSSVEEDLGTRSEWDPPNVPADDIEFRIPQLATSVLDDGQRRLPASEVELGGSSVPQAHLETSTACVGTPSPPMSTGTSPTIAVGLLPPLPPHAHLSHPLLHHSRHASSLSSPLLPLPNPHLGLRRAHTDSDVGAASHQTESAQRFVLYRATSSFVAELRQVESRLAEAAVQDEDRRALERVEGLVASSAPDAEAGVEKATE